MRRADLDDERLRTVVLFMESSTRLQRVFARTLEEHHGLALSTFEAMIRVERAPEARLTMGALASEMVLTTGGITRLVDRMITAGLAERVPDDHDRRVLWVALTDPGRRLLAEALTTHLEDVDRELFDRLEDGEAEALVRIFERLR